MKRNNLAYRAANNIDIRIVQNGFCELSSKWNAKNVCSPFSRIYYIYSGEGYIRTQNQTLKLTSGNCYFIPQGLHFDYWCDSSLHQLYFHVTVTDSGTIDFFKGIQSFGCIPFDEEKAQRLLGYFKDESFINSVKIRTIINESIFSFMEQLQISAFPSDKYSGETVKAIRYISQHLSLQLKVDDIANNQFISKSKLSSLFRKEMGKSIGKYIDEMIFERAEFMIVKTDASIKKISDEFGFCDQFYFSRRFRQYFGKTPSEYRRMYNKVSRI